MACTKGIKENKLKVEKVGVISWLRGENIYTELNKIKKTNISKVVSSRLDLNMCV